MSAEYPAARCYIFYLLQASAEKTFSQHLSSRLVMNERAALCTNGKMASSWLGQTMVNKRF